MSVVATAISLLPLVRCYSRSTLGAEAHSEPNVAAELVPLISKTWLLWLFVSAQLHCTIVSVPSNEQQRVFMYMEKVLGQAM
ncbi:predicted protein [Lichtheimia corymbifera JMRC:FSU:9682]|uniref:Uncharacterized protein n=1 Tax=Lichtheimia corymbifera JMRC:FSU:9682 TaxID=1263082 RepID=A0A068RQF2_9FUNG|nr:predicted protein [Lichtheimia corymbifera JMRC:FSU:9682]